MNTNARKKKIVNIPSSRWLGYAAAGAASALAGAPMAEGEIHYSGLLKVRFQGTTTSSRSFQLSPYRVLAFQRTINFTDTRSDYDGANAHFAIFASGGSAAGFFKTCNYSTDVASLSNLQKGDAVSQRPFVPQGGVLATVDGLGCGGGGRGEFFDGVGYIGFKFSSKRGVQYGWARVKFTGNLTNRFEVVDYAVADPGEPISAGQKSSAKENRSQDTRSDLGWLACGAAGLLAWRKQRRASFTR